jgi:predicted nucleic acid-binding protein
LSVYIDTGILVKSYLFEKDSPEAIAIIEAAGDPLIFSHLHEIEIPNAVRLKRFRGEITKAEESSALRVFRGDIDAGRLVRPDYDLPEVFLHAERLSARHSAEMGSRSLDLLHVAAALECGCASLASFDQRQRRAAVQAGLKLIPSRRRGGP